MKNSRNENENLIAENRQRICLVFIAYGRWWIQKRRKKLNERE